MPSLSSRFAPSLLALGILALSACGGRGGSATPAPANLSYSGSASLTAGQSASLTPTVQGSATGWSVVPALPSGLTLNATTGAISGTPTDVSPTSNFTVTAANNGGSAMAVLSISVALSTADAASAQAASLSAQYTLASGSVTLQWTNTFSAASQYAVQTQASDGTWSTLFSMPTSSAATLSWSGNITAATTFRVQAVLSGYNAVLETSAGQREIAIAPPATTPAIVVAGASPVAAATQVSLSGAGTYSKVLYALDSVQFGSSTQGSAYAVTLDPNMLPSGTHALWAQLIVSADLSLMLQKSVQTQSEISAGVTLTGVTGPIQAQVSAISDFGITRVSASLDGVSLGSLTAPNACPPVCGLTPTLYGFNINASTAGSGAHALVITVTDGNGETQTLRQTVQFNNPPVQSFSPPDGAIVFGTLAITGTVASDKVGPVTTVIKFNGTQLLSTTSGSISTNYDVSSIAAGSYSLSFQSTDSQGTETLAVYTVTVASAANLVFTPIARLTLGTVLVAEDNLNYVENVNPDVSNFTFDTPNSSAQLAGSATPANPGGWHLLGGAAFADAFGTDRSGADNNVYEWSTAGVRTDVSLLAGSTSIVDLLLAAHDDWLLWEGQASGGIDSYTLYNLSTSATLHIALPPGTTILGSSADFFLNGPNLAAYFEAANGTTSDIYRWDQTGGVTTRITTSGSAGPVQTDGTYVAWEDGCPVLGNQINCVLNVTPVSGGTPTMLSSSLLNFAVAGGVVAWQEGNAMGGGIKVYSSAGTAVVSNRLSARIVGAANGYLLYTDNGKLYAWSASAALPQVVFDGTPQFAALSGSTVYFTSGQTSYALYQVSLPLP